LAGLVGITGCCNVIDPHVALFIGILSGAIYYAINRALVRCEIDDPVDALPIHFGIGLSGTIFTGLFHKHLGLFTVGAGKLLGA